MRFQKTLTDTLRGETRPLPLCPGGGGDSAYEGGTDARRLT